MNIFEHAMQMELDGQKYYEDSAQKVELPQLKQILMELADDEVKHYNLFKAMRDNQPAAYEEATKTTILSKTINIFNDLKKENNEFTFCDDIIHLWQHACDVEKNAEEFYRKAASDESDTAKAEILRKIADEEHNHWQTIDNIISFLKRPTQWLDDAEWRSIENI